MKLAVDNAIVDVQSRNDSDLSDTFHIGFESHHVTVTSSVPQISRQLVRSVAPMLRSAPHGIKAGSFDVAATRHGIVIRNWSSASCVHSMDWEAAAQTLHHSAVKVLIEARQDLLWMHAGVVAYAGQAVIVTGPSGHGKSTIVGEFLAHGWNYLSDEIAAIDFGTASVVPFPLTPYRRVSSKKCLSKEEVLHLDKIRIELAEHAISRVSVPIESIYFLCYSPGQSAIRLDPCSPGAAVIEMLRNSLSPSEARDEEIGRLCSLVARVRSACLYYSDANEAAAHIIRLRSHAPAPASV